MVCNGSLFSINGKIFRDLDEKNQPIIPVQKTRKRKTPIYGVLINDKTDIVYYESVSEAARHQNCSRQSISKCINGSTKYTNVNKRIWRKVGDF